MKDDFDFDEVDVPNLSFSLKSQEIEVGGQYPIYGMITNIYSDGDVDAIIIVNDSIQLRLSSHDHSRIEEIKRQCFEPAIFISHITSIGDIVEGECDSIIFGKRIEDIHNIVMN